MDQGQVLTLARLRDMKRTGRKIAAVVVYDFQTAKLADRAGVDLISAGDSVGVNVWGHASDRDVTLDEMSLICRAVRRGVSRALISSDVPLRSLEAGIGASVDAAHRLADEGADLVKIDVAAASTDTVRAVVASGVAVWPQFGGDSPAASTDELVRQATSLEAAGASLLDFRHSGPVAGSAVVRAVSIPVLGGLGGGPWLDGRVRALAVAFGNLAAAVDDNRERYANIAQTTLEAIEALCADIRAARPLRGER